MTRGCSLEGGVSPPRRALPVPLALPIVHPMVSDKPSWRGAAPIELSGVVNELEVRPTAHARRSAGCVVTREHASESRRHDDARTPSRNPRRCRTVRRAAVCRTLDGKRPGCAVSRRDTPFLRWIDDQRGAPRGRVVVAPWGIGAFGPSPFPENSTLARSRSSRASLRPRLAYSGVRETVACRPAPPARGTPYFTFRVHSPWQIRVAPWRACVPGRIGLSARALTVPSPPPRDRQLQWPNVSCPGSRRRVYKPYEGCQPGKFIILPDF